MNSRARLRRKPIRFANGASFTADLCNPDHVRFLFSSLTEAEVAEMVAEAVEEAKKPQSPPFVVTHIDRETKTVTFGSGE